MGSSGGGSQTQTSEPWKAQKPYLQDVFSQAKNLYNQGGAQYYPGSTVAPLSGYSQQAIDLMAQRGLNGSPVETAAQNEATRTLNGDYLNNNPYLDSIWNQQAGDITSRVQSQFGAAGRTGSGINQQVLERELTNGSNQLYGGAYDAERARMMQAAALAPQTAGMDYTNLGNVAQAGSVLDQQNQNVLDADVNRWNYNQNLPYNTLQQYAGLVGGNYGNTTTTTDNTSKNPWASALGGAAMGASMGAGGWGADAGGLAGLLSSFMK